MAIGLQHARDGICELIRATLIAQLADQIGAKNTALDGKDWSVPDIVTTNIRIRTKLDQLPTGVYPEVRIAPSNAILLPTGNADSGFLEGGFVIASYLSAPEAAGAFDSEELLILSLLAFEQCVALTLKKTGGTGLKGNLGINGVDVVPLPQAGHTFTAPDNVTAAVSYLRVTVHGETRY